MDHLNKHLVTTASSQKFDPTIRAAIMIGKKTLNRYYNWMDHSELYRIAMGKCIYDLLFRFIRK